MRKVLVLAVLTACGTGLEAESESDFGTATWEEVPAQVDHAFAAHLNLRKGEARRGGGSTALMSYHNGPVLTSATTYAIFWGSEWASATFAGDKISGIQSFLTGFNASNYAGTSTEYYDLLGNSKFYVSRNVAYGGDWLDSSSAPASALTPKQAVAEVCAVTGNAPAANGVYFIYTSTGAGAVNYCAWHSSGACANGAPVQVAYMPNIDGLAGCNPGDTWTTHSEGLAALANVTAHELSEALTDPRATAWYDASGQENGDKCAWAFVGPVTLSNGTTWKLQMEWSNNAYSTATGYANLQGQRGCLQGQ